MENDMTTPKKSFHVQVAERLIEQLKEGTAPWQKPWDPGVDPTPVNPASGKNYRGINDLWLRMANFPDPRFMTYNQANKAGYTVKKGSKGMPVQYWVWEEKRDKLDRNGKPVLDKDGKPEKITVQLDRPKVLYYTVFNATQIEGIPELPKRELTWDPVERAESMVKAMNFNNVVNDTLNRAYYSPSQDEIHLPNRASFDNAEAYYDTLLHEAAHGTGHKSRLDRDMTAAFGTAQYAREELRAEIASMMINSQIGLAHDAGNSAAYVNSWVKTLENHPTEILRAAADADKIREYMLERERTIEHTQTNSIIVEQSIYDIEGKFINSREIPLRESIQEPDYSKYEFHDPLSDLSIVQINEDGSRFTLGSFETSEADKAFAYLKTVANMSPIKFNPDSIGEFEVRGVVIDEANECIDSYPIENASEEQIAKYSTFGVYTRLNDDTQEHMADFDNYEFARTYAWAASRKFALNYEREQGRPADVATTTERTSDMTSVKHWRKDKEIEIPTGSTGIFEVRGCTFDNDSQRINSVSIKNTEAADMPKFDAFGVYTTLGDGSRAHMKDFATLEEANNFVVRAEEKNSAIIHSQAEEQLQEQPMQSGQRSRYNNDDPSARTYINVPKWEKDEAKSLGAKWDHPNRSWYAPGNIDKQPFEKWMNVEQSTAPSQSQAPARKEREYLAVPYKEKDQARKAGARWDGMEKSWYVAKENSEALARCEKWRCRDNKPERCSTEPTLSPEEEFRSSLVRMGARESSLQNHPITDGNFHRLEEQRDKNGEKSMSYKFYPDGRPAGFIQNNRTGEKTTWKAKGHTLTENAKAEIRSEAGKKLEQRAQTENKERDQAVALLKDMISKIADKEPNKTPYMDAKGIDAHAGTYRMGPSDNVLVVPSYNTRGDLQSAQYVQADGEKRFAAKTAKTSSFHVVGHGTSDALKNTPAIVICEGYATAATITEAVGYPTVSAFDSGNLSHVAKALREQYPDKPIIMAADDDAHQTNNPGKIKALTAAKEVGGYVELPRFTVEQKAQAEASGKKLTDFNDLAQTHPEGKEAVKRQITQAIEIHKAQRAKEVAREKPLEITRAKVAMQR